MRNNMVGITFNTARRLYLRRIPVIPKMLWALNRIIFACDIPYTADVHPTVTFSHNGLGVVVNGKSSIGKNTIILPNVTIGGNSGKEKIVGNKRLCSPAIGDNVLIGAGASVLGPVIIGSNSQIGAGAVVLCDVPEWGLAVGVPARVKRVGKQKTNDTGETIK